MPGDDRAIDLRQQIPSVAVVEAVWMLGRQLVPQRREHFAIVLDQGVEQQERLLATQEEWVGFR